MKNSIKEKRLRFYQNFGVKSLGPHSGRHAGKVTHDDPATYFTYQV